jgi:hypothetical protein
MKVDFSAALAGHNVRKVGRDEGELVEVLGLRMNWKVKAKDTGYAFSVYEMELAPGQGIPLHTHPYPEFFYVLDGCLDFERIGCDYTATLLIRMYFLVCLAVFYYVVIR